MTRHRKTSRLGRFFGTLGSAIAVTAAVEAGRKPFARDLAALGIEPRRFAAIRRP